MKTVTIRGIDENLDKMIKTLAGKAGMSINQWLIMALKKATCLDRDKVFNEYHDLDSLAGGWPKEEALQFRKNTGIFEAIDEEIWK